MSNYERIAERYGKGFVTDEQLLRYVALGVITAEQADILMSDGDKSGR